MVLIAYRERLQRIARIYLRGATVSATDSRSYTGDRVVYLLRASHVQTKGDEELLSV